MRRFSILSLLVLGGCATQWTNPQLSEADQARQLKIDNGYCLSVAHGSVPMPAVPAAAPPPAAPYGYNVQGTASTYNYGNGYSSTSYTATATPRSGGFAGGVAQGMQNAQNNMALYAMASAKRDRDAVVESCMLRLGWLDSKDTAAVAARAVEQRKASLPQSDTVDAAIARVPRLSFVRAVDIEKFNVIAAIDASMRTAPEWQGRDMAERFEAATATYERTAGPIVLPIQPSALDTPDITAKRGRLAEGYAILAELEKTRDTANAEKFRPAVAKLEREIYSDRAWAKLAREHMQLPETSVGK